MCIAWPWNVNVQVVANSLFFTCHVVIECTTLTTVALCAHGIVGWEELEAERILLLANHDEPVVLDSELSTSTGSPLGRFGLWIDIVSISNLCAAWDSDLVSLISPRNAAKAFAETTCWLVTWAVIWMGVGAIATPIPRPAMWIAIISALGVFRHGAFCCRSSADQKCQDAQLVFHHEPTEKAGRQAATSLKS